MTIASQPVNLTAASIRGSAQQPRSSGGYNLPIGYLRAFVTLVVLAFHSVLAYYPAAPPPPQSLVARPLWWTAFPVVDPHRWFGFAPFVAFNDIYFMSLMFLLSGLFVTRSLARQGSGSFLRHRAARLGIPFLFAAFLLAPLAYFPSYLQIPAAHHTVSDYMHQWLSLGQWPAGPAWFVWVLLAFDVIAAALFLLLPKFSAATARLGAFSPGRFFGLLLGASAVCYIPMELLFNPLSWTVFGPFYVQTSRILHYLLYFFAGICIGSFGIDRGLLAPDGKLARRWRLWTGMALTAFTYAAVTELLAIAKYHQAPYEWGLIAGSGFVLSCAATCFALLAIFVRFVRKPRETFDGLRDNAYGMYLIHYVFVSWVQFAILRVAFPGLAKGVIAFAAVLCLSVFTTAALRRIPAVRRIL